MTKGSVCFVWGHFNRLGVGRGLRRKFQFLEYLFTNRMWDHVLVSESVRSVPKQLMSLKDHHRIFYSSLLLDTQVSNSLLAYQFLYSVLLYSKRVHSLE